MDAARDEAGAFRAAVHTAGQGGAWRKSHGKRQKPSAAAKAVLTGKRVLDLTVARALAPSAAYLYETTDGRKVRVFYGRRRVSTSSLIAIGKDRAVFHCLVWAWANEELLPGGQKNPHDFSKIKLQKHPHE